MSIFLVVAAILIGESLAIIAEVWSAKYFIPNEPWYMIFLVGFFLLLSVVLLILGYTYGYRIFKNIWIISAISISGIIVVEPIVDWIIFRQLPTTGALIALLLGVTGIIISILVK